MAYIFIKFDLDMNVVIVESPAKCRTISTYLNNIRSDEKFIVIASFGHIRDLPKEKNCINLENFEANYEIGKDKIKHVKDLKEKTKCAKKVYIATDQDREGEGIAWHIVDHLKLNNNMYHRITFNEITKTALERALKAPRKLDMNLVDAQKARRVLDRLFGYETTGVLFKAFSNGAKNMLSAGRVQSAVLKILVDKETEIEKHIPENYWLMEGQFQMENDDVVLEAKCSDRFQKLNEATNILTSFTNKPWVIQDTVIKQRTVQPGKPFITSTLQQEAHSTLGYGINHTMKLAQDLYEAGHITYMRTDSVALSADAMESIEKYISLVYGEDYFMNRNAIAKNSAHSQEAHECIRVTNFNVPTIEMSQEHVKLYTMIFKRTVASQMKSTIYYDVDVKLQNTCGNIIAEKHIFVSTISKVIYDGWKRVYDSKIHDSIVKGVDVENLAESFMEKRALCTSLESNHHWTQPHVRYTEASIVKQLEKEGIGRPSTYAGILKKLLDKNYIVTDSPKGKDVDWIHLKRDMVNGADEATSSIKKIIEKKPLISEKKKLLPTDIGKNVNRFMDEHFPSLIEKGFTNNMERTLDEIANGKAKYAVEMKEFYINLSTLVTLAKSNIQEKTILNTNECNKILIVDNMKYIIRRGKYGPVLQYSTNTTSSPIYISLESYLKLKSIKMEDISEGDVMFLLRLPMKLFNDASIVLGKYGFYVKKGEQNIRLFPKEQKLILENKLGPIKQRLQKEEVGDGADDFT